MATSPTDSVFGPRLSRRASLDPELLQRDVTWDSKIFRKSAILKSASDAYESAEPKPSRVGRRESMDPALLQRRNSDSKKYQNPLVSKMQRRSSLLANDPRQETREFSREGRRIFLIDEQERIQKKTFTKWVNLYLCQHDASYKIADLYQDIKDGVRLLLLLEVLSRERLPREQGRLLQRVHYLSNVKRALDFLEKRGIKMVNINPTDIVDGKPSIILGLIWTIILHFDLETNDIIEATLASSDHSEEFKNFKGSAKQCLLAWTGKQVTEKYGIPVKDFTASWRDGKAFNAMVHNIDPTLVDMDEVRAQENRVNLENAFSVAEKELGIPRLLDPEDVDVERPDEKSIMTYLAQFVRVYSAERKPKVVDEVDDALHDIPEEDVSQSESVPQ